MRAGHDPALLYDPEEDRFEELKGGGMALGVDPDLRYRAVTREVSDGQVILLGTDGIWEARSPAGEMLGKEPVRRLLRERAHQSADEILAALADRVQAFIGDGRPEDDLTMVVVKIVPQEGTLVGP